MNKMTLPVSICKTFSRAAVIMFLHIFLCACAGGELTRTAFSLERENLPKEHENIKFVFFADLHLRKETIQEKIFRELAEEVNRENADFILIGGDLVDRTVKNYTDTFAGKVSSYLKKFRSKYGIILCPGNHENAADASSLIKTLEKEGVIYLSDAFYTPLVNGKKLAFYGKADKSTPKRVKGRKYVRPAWSFYHTPGINLLRKEKFIQEDMPLFILSHRPELFDFLDEKENIFILAGHYHGGLVDLPFLPAEYLLSRYQKRKYPERPPLKYIHGKYEKGRKVLYVTSGISGGDHSALRINVPREYVVITLKRAGKEK